MKTFKDVKDFEKWIRIKRKGLPDVVEVDGIVYTMDYYDMEGRELAYGNKRTGNYLRVVTDNRYSKTGNPLKNTKVELIENSSYCIGINYVD